jgi:hypothetical protein
MVVSLSFRELIKPSESNIEVAITLRAAMECQAGHHLISSRGHFADRYWLGWAVHLYSPFHLDTFTLQYGKYPARALPNPPADFAGDFAGVTETHNSKGQ